MRSIYPVKYYSDEGFVEHKIELHDEDLEEIIRESLEEHADFDWPCAVASGLLDEPFASGWFASGC